MSAIPVTMIILVLLALGHVQASEHLRRQKPQLSVLLPGGIPDRANRESDASAGGAGGDVGVTPAVALASSNASASAESDSDEDAADDAAEDAEDSHNHTAPAAAPVAAAPAPALQIVAAAPAAIHPTHLFPKTRRAAREQREFQEKLTNATQEETKAIDALQKNRAMQRLIEMELEHVLDTKANHEIINTHVSTVSNETGTRQFAMFLGDMWKDMNMFASPFYAEALEKKLDFLQDEETRLMADQAQKTHERERLEWMAAKAAKRHHRIIHEEALERKMNEMGKHVRKEKIEAEGAEDAWIDAEDNRVEAPKQAEAAETAEGAPRGPGKVVPERNSEGGMKVSAAVLCIILLCAQFFFVFTLLAMARSMNHFTAGKYTHFEETVEKAKGTVGYALMLSLLFLAARMRAIQLTQGDTDTYGLPQWWVKICMYYSTMAVCVQTLYALLFDDGSLMRHLRAGELTGVKKIFTYTLLLIRETITTTFLVAVGVVVYGIVAMPVPESLWKGEPVPVSPAVWCTIVLMVTYYIVVLKTQIVDSLLQYGVAATHTAVLERLQGICQAGRNTVNVAPMCCILFIGARMRALQIDPVNGSPQGWAVDTFYYVTFALVFQTVFVILMPLVFGKGADVERGTEGAQVSVTFRNRALNIASIIITSALTLCIYLGSCAVVVSIFTISAEDGATTPPISPAAKCTIFLTSLYFIAFLLLYVANTIEGNLAKGRIAWSLKLRSSAEAATKAVMFAPMLSVLFWAARLRALQLTRAKDGSIPAGAGPQPWAQQAMYLASWSIFIQLVITLVFPWLVGADDGESMTTADGMYQPPRSSPPWLIIALDVLKWTSMVLMYGGALIVIYAIFVMAPETLPPNISPRGFAGTKVEHLSPPVPEQ